MDSRNQGDSNSVYLLRSNSVLSALYNIEGLEPWCRGKYLGESTQCGVKIWAIFLYFLTPAVA